MPYFFCSAFSFVVFQLLLSLLLLLLFYRSFPLSLIDVSRARHGQQSHVQHHWIPYYLLIVYVIIDHIQRKKKSVILLLLSWSTKQKKCVFSSKTPKVCISVNFHAFEMPKKQRSRLGHQVSSNLNTIRKRTINSVKNYFQKTHTFTFYTVHNYRASTVFLVVCTGNQNCQYWYLAENH